MSKRSSIGSWAYTIGPYAKNPIDFDTVCDKLKALGFEGVELGAFPRTPIPATRTGRTPNGREPCRRRRSGRSCAPGWTRRGLGLSGMAANLWGEKLINTDDQTKYIAGVREELRVCAGPGHSGHSRGLRPAPGNSPQRRLLHCHGSGGPNLENVLRYRR